MTLRERDTMQQVRVSVNQAAAILRDLCEERTTWQSVGNKYGLVGSDGLVTGKFGSSMACTFVRNWKSWKF